MERTTAVSSYPGPAVAWSGVALLFLVYASSFVDRQIMSLLVMPMRVDLGISDTQFSILNGFAFAAFYAVLGIPIGRLVDQFDRRVILSIGITLWSVFTMLCGRASSFSGLFAARIGVGIGEGTVAPGTYSLLADYFPVHRRGAPMGLFGAGVYFGIGLAFIVGGTVVGTLQRVGTVRFGALGEFRPWQAAFVIVGFPGLLLAAAVLVLFEPRRRPPTALHVHDHRKPAHLLSFWRDGGIGIVAHHLATASLAMALYAVVAWSPEYFRRTFDVSVRTAGIWIGTIICVFGTCGVVGGGLASDRLLRRGVKAARLKTIAAAAAMAAPCLYAFSTAYRADIATGWLAMSVLLLAVLTACGPLGVQELYPSRLRGQGAACFQLVVTLIGLGVGPTAVALVSDSGSWGTRSLGIALSRTAPVMALAAAGIALAGTKFYAITVARATSLSLKD
jgi:MFS family permease